VPQEKTEIRAENVSRRQQQSEPVQASGVVRAATATPTSVAALEIPAASQKSDSYTIGPDHPMNLSEQLKNVKEDIFERKRTTVSSNGETAKSARAGMYWANLIKNHPCPMEKKFPCTKKSGKTFPSLFTSWEWST
jgi:hypothetical protein